jgi:hypothetical protein
MVVVVVVVVVVETRERDKAAGAFALAGRAGVAMLAAGRERLEHCGGSPMARGPPPGEGVQVNPPAWLRPPPRRPAAPSLAPGPGPSAPSPRD